MMVFNFDPYANKLATSSVVCLPNFLPTLTPTTLRGGGREYKEFGHNR